jgi:lysophospholipase L1-like esterase
MVQPFDEMRLRITVALRWVLLCAAMIIANSCASADHPNETPMPRVVVIFGDSTSAPRPGVRVFASIIQEQLGGAKIINTGVPGNTTRDALARMNRDVISQHPDVVTVFLGINDSAVDVWKGETEPRVRLEDYRNNLREMIGAIRGAGATPILLTPNPVSWTPELKKLYGQKPYEPENGDGWNVLLVHYAEAVREIAAEEKVALVDVDRMFREYAAEPGHRLDDLLLDGMHPNDAGQRLIARGVMGKIE